MKLYHWHPTTKEYVGSSDARVDPEEHRLAVERAIASNPTAAKVSVEIMHWIIPGDATPDVPPPVESERHVVRRLDSIWVNELKPEFKPETPDDAAVRIVSEATAALAETQAVVVEYFEHQNPVPAHIVAYRDALREIIKAGGHGVTEIPAKPEV